MVVWANVTVAATLCRYHNFMSDYTTTSANAAYQLLVEVRPEYLAAQSEPQRQHYVFAYHVTITNTGQVAAQVVARHWIITDAQGRTEEVKGLAVVGHQPVLEPGEHFSYSSGTALHTAHGTMHGSYFCVAVDGERFEAPVAVFTLQADDAHGRTALLASAPRVLH